MNPPAALPGEFPVIWTPAGAPAPKTTPLTTPVKLIVLPPRAVEKPAAVQAVSPAAVLLSHVNVVPLTSIRRKELACAGRLQNANRTITESRTTSFIEILSLAGDLIPTASKHAIFHYCFLKSGLNNRKKTWK